MTEAPPSDDFLLGGELRVDRLGFGAMRLALGQRTPDRETATAILRRAVELGVNHVDTAGFYGFGETHAHELIRHALSPYPEELVIATKVGPLFDGGTPVGEAGAEQLRGLVEQDLRRLGADRLDLVYLRVGGRGEPGGEQIGERFGALAQLRDEGLIRHLGLSHVDAAQLAEARAIAPVAAVQNRFNVFHRADCGMIARCADAGIAYVPYFPLGGGASPGDTAALKEVAARHRVTIAQVALAWLLTLSPVILAIPGTGSLDHLVENIASRELHLTDDDLRQLAAQH